MVSIPFARAISHTAFTGRDLSRDVDLVGHQDQTRAGRNASLKAAVIH